MTQTFKIPWALWKEPEFINLDFPDSWDISFFEMEGAKYRELSEVEIANSPIPLKTKIIKDSYILNRLKYKRLQVGKIKISGSKKVVVSLKVEEISEEKIYDVVKKYLEKKLPYRPENCEISFEKKIKSIFVPANSLHIDIIERKIGIESTPEKIYKIVTDGVNTPKWNPVVNDVINI